MDLFGPMSTSTLNGKYYAFVIVDDFSRFTWVLFFTHKVKLLISMNIFAKG